MPLQVYWSLINACYCKGLYSYGVRLLSSCFTNQYRNLMVWNLSIYVLRFSHWLKIGLQCVLGVLCLILFLLFGMLFSNISIWELNCYKWKGRQVITTLKWKMYGSILFTYFISNNIIEGFCARRACMGNSMLQTLHSEGKFLELKLFLTYCS